MKHKIQYDDEIRLIEALKILREWRAPDTYPWMREKTVKLLSPYIGYILTAFIVAIHYFWATQSLCSINFQRGGALVVLVSAVLFAWVEWHTPNHALLSGGRLPKFSFFSPLVSLPLIAVFGTLLWGYGDLLPWLQSTKC